MSEHWKVVIVGGRAFCGLLPGCAMMFAIDLATNKVVKTIVFSSTTVTPTTYVNDARFDLRQGKAGFAYLTDSAATGPGGIIVVDLDSGDNWRRLTGHPSTSPDPSFIPLVEGERFELREKGKPPIAFNPSSDGIAISADGLKLSTELLRDRSVGDAAVAKSIVDLGEKGASDGLADDKGRVYAGDYENNCIPQLQTNGEWQTIAHDPRILWPDTLSVASNGYLSFTANQLHRQPQLNEGVDRREKPHVLVRMKIDAGPVLLN